MTVAPVDLDRLIDDVVKPKAADPLDDLIDQVVNPTAGAGTSLGPPPNPAPALPANAGPFRPAVPEGAMDRLGAVGQRMAGGPPAAAPFQPKYEGPLNAGPAQELVHGEWRDLDPNSPNFKLPLDAGVAAGVIRGAGRMVEAVPRVVGMAAELMGRPAAARQARGIADAVGQIPDAVASSPEAQGFNPGKIRWWTENLAEQGPNIAAGMASGGASALAGGGRTAQIAAAVLPTFGLESAEAYKATGDPVIGTGVGLVNAALDMVPFSQVFTSNPVGRALLRRLGAQAAPKFIQRLASVAPAEAMAESLQELTQALGSYAGGDPKAFEGLGERMAAAGLLGGAGGAGMAAVAPHGIGSDPGQGSTAPAQGPTMPQVGPVEQMGAEPNRTAPTPQTPPNAPGVVRVAPPGAVQEPDWAAGVSDSDLRRMAREVGARDRAKDRTGLIADIAAKRPAAPLTPPESALPQWVKDEVAERNADAEKAGIADQIEELSAQRLTAAEVAKRLGTDKPTVYAVRSHRGIPSMDAATEFEGWLKSRGSGSRPSAEAGLLGASTPTETPASAVPPSATGSRATAPAAPSQTQAGPTPEPSSRTTAASPESPAPGSVPSPQSTLSALSDADLQREAAVRGITTNLPRDILIRLIERMDAIKGESASAAPFTPPPDLSVRLVPGQAAAPELTPSAEAAPVLPTPAAAPAESVRGADEGGVKEAPAAENKPATPNVAERYTESSTPTKQPWEMTIAQFARSGDKSAARSAHKGLVRDALAAGYPVPPEVLADYPDLKEKSDAQSNGASVEAPSREEGTERGGGGPLRVRDDAEAGQTPQEEGPRAGTERGVPQGEQEEEVAPGAMSLQQLRDAVKAGGISIVGTKSVDRAPKAALVRVVEKMRAEKGKPAETPTPLQEQTKALQDQGNLVIGTVGRPKPTGILSALSPEKQARAEALKKRLAAKINNEVRSGFDPELFAIGAELSSLYIEAGARRFGAFSKALVTDLGEKIKPYLKSFYLAARNMPGVDATEMDRAKRIDELSEKDIDQAAEHGELWDDPIKMMTAREGAKQGKPNPLADRLHEIADTLPGSRKDLLHEWASVFEHKPEKDHEKYRRDLAGVVTSRHMESFGVDAGHAILAAMGLKLDPHTETAVAAGPTLRKSADAPAISTARDVAALLAGDEKITADALFKAAAKHHGGTLAQGKFSAKDAYDSAELGMNMWVAKHAGMISPRGDLAHAHAAAKILDDKTAQLPTQTRRDAETESFQQFSTPPPYAYAINWLANIKPGEMALEPSAGTGSIAVHAMNAGAKVYVNELAKDRAALVEALKPAGVFTEDAEQINKILPATVKPSVVVMNPPFSQTAGRMGDKKVTMTGARHIEEALSRLQPGGRLVAIVGRGMAPDAPTFAPWWGRIGKQYAVRANVGVSGQVYKKYGTTFATRVLVIDKTAPAEGEKPVTGHVESIPDLMTTLVGVRNARDLSQLGPDEPGVQEAPAGARAEAAERPAVRGATDAVGTGQRGGKRPADVPGPAPGQRGQPLPSARNEGDAGTGAEPGRAAGVGERAGGDAGTRGDQSPASVPSATGGEPAGVRGSATADVTLEAPAEQAAHDAGDLGTAVFEQYRPRKVKVKGAQPHPTELVESAAMAAVSPPDAKYTPSLPADTITEGRLSDAQLEAIVYAGQAHEQTLPDGTRKGYFIGDGTGVGKGAQIAGIILDNWNKGRTKHVWVSEKPSLSLDAQRDLKWVGADPDTLIRLSKVSATEAIKSEKGVLFTSYATLRNSAKGKGGAKGKRRVDQIAEWLGKDFDGVIAFDEAHNMANAVEMKETGKRGASMVSQAAQAGLELAAMLPKARVVYVSATGATEVRNLAYADRLGLWGQGTAFPKKETFIQQVASGGIAAMELVARDMKAMGLYLARGQSFSGVTQDRVEHALTKQQQAVYNELAGAWQVVLRDVNAALGLTASVVKPNGDEKVDSNAKAAAMSAFYGAQQRFFNQTLTSLQMPTVIKAVEADLKAGKAAVLQIVNTDEAAQERAIANMEEGDALEDLDLTPRQQLMEYVKRSFPVAQMEQYTDPLTKKEGMRPVKDSQGNFVENPQAVAMREALLDKLGSIRVPDGPLDTLIEHFGAERVAEVTGRKRRRERVKNEDGLEETRLVSRPGAANVTEVQAFQGGKKDILIFSMAGGTGASYHADSKAVNQKKRTHYLLQAGWRADKAVQGLGRTKRTGEVQPPEYHLVQTDLPGHKRFISTIARRLDQLGALTKGQRQTGSQGLFNALDNLESKYAKDALENFYIKVADDQFRDIPLGKFEAQTGLRIKDDNGNIRKELPPIHRFLNRLLALEIDMQNAVFDAFARIMQEKIEDATRHGTLDVGVENYKAESITKNGEETVYTDKQSGAETKLVSLHIKTKPDRMTFEGASYQAGAKTGEEKFYRNVRSGRPVVVAPRQGSRTDHKTGRVTAGHTAWGQKGKPEFIPAVDLYDDSKWVEMDRKEARAAWNEAMAKLPEFDEETLHLVTGAILPVWDRLKGQTRVWRLKTDAGEKLLGRVVPEEDVQATLQRFGVHRQGWMPEGAGEAAAAVMDRKFTLNLSNGWKIKPSEVAGDTRIELVGPEYDHNAELQRAGVFIERHSFKTRYYIPTGPRAASVIEAITEHRQIIEAVPPRKGTADKIADAAGAIADAAAERIANRTIPRGRGTGATTLIEDAIDTGIIVGARVVQIGAKRAARIEKTVRTVLGELGRPDLAKHAKDIARVARRIVRLSRGDDKTFTAENFARAIADAQERKLGDQPTTKATVAESTGAGRKQRKTLSASAAYAISLRREERAGRQAYKVALAEAKNRLDIIADAQFRKGEAKALRGAITERAKGEMALEAQKGREAERESMRKEAVELVRRHAPREIRGEMMTQVAQATTPLRLFRVARRLRKEMALFEARKARDAAEKYGRKDLGALEPELRTDADAAMGAIARLKAELVAAEKGTKADIPRLEVIRDELQAALNTVKSAIYQQKNLDTVRIAGEVVQSERLRAEVGERLATIKELPTPETGAPEPGALTRLLRKRTNWGSLMQAIDAWKKGGAAVRLFNEALRGRRESIRLQREFKVALDRIVKANGYKSIGAFQSDLSGTLGRSSQKMLDVPLGKRKRITLGEAAYLYAAWGDAGVQARVKSGQPFQFRDNPTDQEFTLTEADFDRVADALPANVRKIVDEAKAAYDDHYFERMSRVNKRLKGYFLEKVPGYWGIQINRSFSEGKGTPFSWTRAVIRSLEESGFMQERVGPSKVPMLIGDFGTDITRRSAAAATTVGKAEITKLLARVMLHPETQAAITRGLGREAVQRLERRISLYSGGDMFRQADAPIIRILTGLWARGKTQLWLPTWIRNATAGSARMMNDLPAGAVVKAAFRERPTWNEYRDLINRSPELWERWEGHGLSGFYDPGATGGEARFTQAMGATFRQLAETARNLKGLKLGEVLTSAKEAGKPWRAVLDAITIGNYFDAAGAILAYRHFKSIAPKGWSEDAQKNWAARKATRVFERGSNTGTLEYANDVQLDARENAIIQQFIPFTGDTAKAQNMLYEAWHKGNKAKARTAGVIAASAGMSALVSLLWAMAMGDDEEKVAGSAVGRLGSEFAGLVPGVGPVAARIAQWAGGHFIGGSKQPMPEFDIPILELVRSAKDIAASFMNAAERMDGLEGRQKLTSGDYMLRALGQLGETAGDVTGLPGGYIYSIRKALKNWGVLPHQD